MTPLTIAFLLDSVPISRDVIAGLTSLGGSESAMIGLARALVARGHKVFVYATKLDKGADGIDQDGVAWHPMEAFLPANQFLTWDVVCSLRMYHWLGTSIKARLRMLWNQDLLVGQAGEAVMSVAWNIDKITYVSDYHRRQWEDVQPELKPIGWVTKNGYDPQFVPAQATKDPNRIIHISRPERGLGPLLAMWPKLKAAHTAATLQICRYASMYDGEGGNVREACLSFDRQVQIVNEQVGGIEYLGSLNKEQLYRAIADAAVMWYPGIAGFAETSCIAAIESQACGTPFVGSLRGALPETVPSGILVTGDAYSPEYQEQSIAAVVKLLQDCGRNAYEYRGLQKAGRTHVEGYTYDVIAGEWEHQIGEWFAERYDEHQVGVLRQLLHEDDHTTALMVAKDIMASEPNDGSDYGPQHAEAEAAAAFCRRVIAGIEQGPEDYAAHAIQDPLQEVERCGRFHEVAPLFKDCTRILDAACGNGAGAITIALANPTVRITGIDYAGANIAHATDAAARAGVGDRCTFIQGAVWDLEAGKPSPEIVDVLGEERFDGAFVGEFVEHVADCAGLIDYIDSFLEDGATVVYTCPSGPFVELMQFNAYKQKGHVHNFESDDVSAVWGGKRDFDASYYAIGLTPRGKPLGHWIIRYTKEDGRPAGQRDYATRAVRTRPMQKLSVGLIAYNAEDDISRCLRSVWAIADEIVVGDTGSVDETRRIAEKYGAKVITLDRIQDQPEGFAGSRNAVLNACTGDWFLWIDADEVLVEGHALRRYMDGAVFNGMVVRQHHLQLDAPAMSDAPVRLFRKLPSIKFFGAVHEQPQMGDCNGDIAPALEVSDAKIAHTGYLTEHVRRDKMLNRNLPLLTRDQEAFPDRLLGKVLVLRDYVNVSDHECDKAGRMTERAQRGYAHAVRLFITYFDDPTHKYHEIARPWYEAALKRLGVGWDLEWAFAGREGGLGRSHAKPQRIWVRDHEELTRVVTARIAASSTRMVPQGVKTDPSVCAPQAAA